MKIVRVSSVNHKTHSHLVRPSINEVWEVTNHWIVHPSLSLALYHAMTERFSPLTRDVAQTFWNLKLGNWDIG